MLSIVILGHDAMRATYLDAVDELTDVEHKQRPSKLVSSCITLDETVKSARHMSLTGNTNCLEYIGKPLRSSTTKAHGPSVSITVLRLECILTVRASLAWRCIRSHVALMTMASAMIMETRAITLTGRGCCISHPVSYLSSM